MAQREESGMFGPMPYEVEEQIRQQRRAEAMQMAQMNPNQVGRYLSASVGDRLGDGVAALTGKQDPRMAQAQELQAIQKRVQDSGINPNDFEAFYGKLGEELAKAGKLKEAANVANVVQKWKENQQNLAIKEEQAQTARLRVQAYKDGKVKYMGKAAEEVFKKNNEYEPATLKAYYDTISPEKPDGDMSLLKPLVPTDYDFKSTPPEGKPVFTNKAGVVKVRDDKGNLVDYNGPVKPTGGVTVGGVTVDSKTDNKTINEAPKRGLTEADNKVLAKYGEGRTAIEDVEPYLKEAEEIAKSEKFISGWLSGGRTELSRGINTALKGIGFGVDDSLVDNTDMLKGYVSKAVLPLLAKIGGNDSNEEMQQMMKAIGNTDMSPAQFRRALALTRKEVDRFKKKLSGLNEGFKKGRYDVTVYDALGYYPDEEVVQAKNAGSQRTEQSTSSTTTTKTPSNAMPNMPQSNVGRAPVATVNAAPPSSFVTRMKARGLTDQQIQELWNKQ